MFKQITFVIIRLIVGGLFILSGMIKVNDPVGTSIKFEEKNKYRYPYHVSCL